MTLYFVDEDHARYQPWIQECVLRDISVEPIEDADTAYARLNDAVDIDLVILDVMLSAMPTTARYTRERTDAYQQTGLRLAEDLVNLLGPAFPSRLVFLTNAVGNEVRRAADEMSQRYLIPMWYKVDIVSSYDFGKRVVKRIDEISGCSRRGKP